MSMHSCPSSYKSLAETSPSSVRQVNCSERRALRREHQPRLERPHYSLSKEARHMKVRSEKSDP
jgi:hypothetical protein